MIQRIFLVLFVMFAVVAAGCGNGAERTNSNVNSVNTVNQNTVSNVNQVVNLLKANVSSDTNSPANNSPAPVTSQPPPKDAKPLSQPAPDNSEVVVSLAENVVKTRTFKNHPQILKVEETMLIKENNRKVIKVYLKNGNVKEIPEGKIADAMTETAAGILKAAG